MCGWVCLSIPGSRHFTPRGLSTQHLPSKTSLHSPREGWQVCFLQNALKQVYTHSYHRLQNIHLIVKYLTPLLSVHFFKGGVNPGKMGGQAIHFTETRTDQTWGAASPHGPSFEQDKHKARN